MKKFISKIIQKKSEDVSQKLRETAANVSERVQEIKFDDVKAKIKDVASTVSEKASELIDKLPEFKFEDVDEDEDSPILSEDNNLDTVTVKRETFRQYSRAAYYAMFIEKYLDKFEVPNYPEDDQTKPFNLFGRVIELARMTRDGKVNKELEDFLNYH